MHNPFAHAFFLRNGCSAKKAANRTFKLEVLLGIKLPNLLPKADVHPPPQHPWKMAIQLGKHIIWASLYRNRDPLLDSSGC